MSPSRFALDDAAFYLDEAGAAEAYRQLRREEPVHWFEPRRFWVLTRYEDIQHVSRSPHLFSSRWITMPPLADAVEADPQQGIPLSIIQMDPPEHNRHRRLISQAFTARMVNRIEARMRQMAAESLEEIPPGETVDFVESVALPLPLGVIAEMLGVPRSDMGDFRRWSDAIIVQAGAEYDQETALTMQLELFSYFQRQLDEHRRDPQDDLLSALVEAEIDGQRLEDLEILIFCMTLLVAGNETTRTLVSQGTRLLLEHPDQLQGLRERKTSLPEAIEEMLRFSTPLRFFFRQARCDTEIRGQSIREKDRIMLLYSAANRDETVWGIDADRFDVTRSVAPHLSFGFGQHFCLGANLARLEARVLFEELFARRPHFEIAGEVEPVRSTFVNGIERMPVVFR